MHGDADGHSGTSGGVCRQSTEAGARRYPCDVGICVSGSGLSFPFRAGHGVGPRPERCGSGFHRGTVGRRRGRCTRRSDPAAGQADPDGHDARRRSNGDGGHRGGGCRAQSRGEARLRDRVPIRQDRPRLAASSGRFRKPGARNQVVGRRAPACAGNAGRSLLGHHFHRMAGVARSLGFLPLRIRARHAPNDRRGRCGALP